MNILKIILFIYVVIKLIVSVGKIVYSIINIIEAKNDMDEEGLSNYAIIFVLNIISFIIYITAFELICKLFYY